MQGFPGSLVVKNPPANAGDKRLWVPFLGQEDLLKEKMATHSDILAWRIPWTEEPGGPQFIRLQSQTRQRQLARVVIWLVLFKLACS